MNITDSQNAFRSAMLNDYRRRSVSTGGKFKAWVKLLTLFDFIYNVKFWSFLKKYHQLFLTDREILLLKEIEF